MIFVLTSMKGGVGKSSISQNLAAYILGNNSDVLLVDADPQRTSAEWAEERANNDLTPIPCVELSGNLKNDLLDLRKRYEHIVVDIGGADSVTMRSSLAVADVAIVPFKPRRRDLKTAPTMAEIIELLKVTNDKLKVFSLITMAPPANQLGRVEDAKSWLSSLNLNPLNAITRHINSWDDSEDVGQSVFDYKLDKKAAEDAKAVFDEIMGAL